MNQPNEHNYITDAIFKLEHSGHTLTAATFAMSLSRFAHSLIGIANGYSDKAAEKGVDLPADIVKCFSLMCLSAGLFHLSLRARREDHLPPVNWRNLQQIFFSALLGPALFVKNTSRTIYFSSVLLAGLALMNAPKLAQLAKQSLSDLWQAIPKPQAAQEETHPHSGSAR